MNTYGEKYYLLSIKDALKNSEFQIQIIFRPLNASAVQYNIFEKKKTFYRLLNNF